MSNNQVVDRNPFIPTLRATALRLCITNANNFASLGDLPFVLVKPILQACSATQLALLEDQSPHLREDTQEIWLRHITGRFRCHFEKRENEDYRDVFERLKLDENERFKNAASRLRAKNGKIKEEKLAKQIVVIDPKKTPVKGDRKRPHPFSSKSRFASRLIGVHRSPPQKRNSLMEKARRDTSKMNYSGAPKFTITRPTGMRRPGRLGVTQNGTTKPRREPAPANDNNIFGRQPEKLGGSV